MAPKFLSVLALSGVLSSILVLAAPSQVVSTSPNSMERNLRWKRQGGPRAVPHNGADYALPPPDDVFKYMADPALYAPPTDLLPATTDPNGLEGGSPNAPEPHKPSGPTLNSPGSGSQAPTSTKLIIVAAVMAGIIAFVICAYLVLDWPLFRCCCRRRRLKNKRNQKTSTIKDVEDGEKSLTPSPNSSLVITVNGLPQGAAVPRPPGSPIIGAHQDGFQVIDIGPAGPHKPQSFISASEYSSNAMSCMRPFSSAVTTTEGTDSVRSSAVPASLAAATPYNSAACLSNAATTERGSSGTVLTQSGNAPLMTPHDFFCMSTSPKDSQPLSQQTKRISKPAVFGHQPTRDYSASEADVSPVKKGNTKRAGDHRKSKSISGLVYVVNTGALQAGSGMGSGAPSGIPGQTRV